MAKRIRWGMCTTDIYAMYYEVARVESLRQLGLTYKSIEAKGIIMPVLENKSKFIAPGPLRRTTPYCLHHSAKARYPD